MYTYWVSSMSPHMSRILSMHVYTSLCLEIWCVFVPGILHVSGSLCLHVYISLCLEIWCVFVLGVLTASGSLCLHICISLCLKYGVSTNRVSELPQGLCAFMHTYPCVSIYGVCWYLVVYMILQVYMYTYPRVSRHGVCTYCVYYVSRRMVCLRTVFTTCLRVSLSSYIYLSLCLYIW